MDIFEKAADKFGVERCKNIDVKEIVKEVGEERELEVKYIGVGDKGKVEKYHIAMQGDVVMVPEELVERFKNGEISSEELRQRIKKDLS